MPHSGPRGIALQLISLVHWWDSPQRFLFPWHVKKTSFPPFQFNALYLRLKPKDYSLTPLSHMKSKRDGLLSFKTGCQTHSQQPHASCSRQKMPASLEGVLKHPANPASVPFVTLWSIFSILILCAWPVWPQRVKWKNGKLGENR